ncbi:MAG: hypothetical protein KJT01_17105 [Gemmatimonadetes bacterium]|nr:hypothetical protein [Gemmatimonadota bacterium]
MTDPAHVLASMLELCFGDADSDDAGRAELLTQLAAYPDRAAPLRAALGTLVAGGDGEGCRSLLATWTHQWMTPREALAWCASLHAWLGTHGPHTPPGTS